jgi:hypothetical protein
VQIDAEVDQCRVQLVEGPVGWLCMHGRVDLRSQSLAEESEEEEPNSAKASEPPRLSGRNLSRNRRVLSSFSVRRQHQEKRPLPRKAVL